MILFTYFWRGGGWKTVGTASPSSPAGPRLGPASSPGPAPMGHHQPFHLWHDVHPPSHTGPGWHTVSQRPPDSPASILRARLFGLSATAVLSHKNEDFNK